MIGTHADCVIADALVKGFRGFDSQKAWQAVKKNAYEPSVGDEEHRFEDRMPWFAGPAPTGGTGVEARGGFSPQLSIFFHTKSPTRRLEPCQVRTCLLCIRR